MVRRSGNVAWGRRTARMARARAGFTLLEMLLVMLLIGGLTAIVVAINFIGQAESARRSLTVTSMRTLQGALNTYNFKTGSFPTTQQGLGALVPAEMNAIPQDAWRVDFAYYATTGDPNRPYELYSMGPDKQPNTPDDIDVWAVEQQ